MGNFLSWCSVFVFGDGSLAMCLRYTSGQAETESMTLFYSAPEFLLQPFGWLVSSLVLVLRLVFFSV